MQMHYEFNFEGVRPILFHADNVMANDLLTEWRKDSRNKSVSVPGDDRSPAWTWQTYLYQDGTNLAVPQENIMACLRKASARISLKGNKSFSEISQTGIAIDSEYCEFRNAGQVVPLRPIQDMATLTFKEQFEAVKKLGFELLVKRASVPPKKHVRTRAMFRAWTVSGVIQVTDAALTKAVLADMFAIAGRNIGLLDWRPGSKTPGPFGTFVTTLVAI